MQFRTLTGPYCHASWAGGRRAWCSAAPVRPQRWSAHWWHRSSYRQHRQPLRWQRCTPQRCRQQPLPWSLTIYKHIYIPDFIKGKIKNLEQEKKTREKEWEEDAAWWNEQYEKDMEREMNEYMQEWKQYVNFAFLQIRKVGNMVEKTVKQIIEENKGKEVHLLDEYGVWGELPLTENNLKQTPNAVEINDWVVRIYIG